MKINKNIYNAFPNYTKSFNKLIVRDFVNFALNYISDSEKDKEELSEIIGKDIESSKNKFFCREVFTVESRGWFRTLIQPGKYKLNDRMWWFASGWIRCRNQILNGNSSSFITSQETQKCFVGCVNVHEKTIQRMRIFFESKDIKLNDEILKEFHDDLVKHYLKNQDVIIKDELEDD